MEQSAAKLKLFVGSYESYSNCQNARIDAVFVQEIYNKSK